MERLSRFHNRPASKSPAGHPLCQTLQLIQAHHSARPPFSRQHNGSNRPPNGVRPPNNNPGLRRELPCQACLLCMARLSFRACLLSRKPWGNNSNSPLRRGTPRSNNPNRGLPSQEATQVSRLLLPSSMRRASLQPLGFMLAHILPQTLSPKATARRLLSRNGKALGSPPTLRGRRSHPRCPRLRRAVCRRLITTGWAPAISQQLPFNEESGRGSQPKVLPSPHVLLRRPSMMSRGRPCRVRRSTETPPTEGLVLISGLFPPPPPTQALTSKPGMAGPIPKRAS